MPGSTFDKILMSLLLIVVIFQLSGNRVIAADDPGKKGQSWGN